MAKKAYEESNIANIAVAVREKTGSNQTYKTSEMPSGVNEVYEKGCVDGYNDGYTKGDSEGYDKGYDTGYEEGFNSAPPDYLQFSEAAKFSNLNLFGKSVLVLDIPLVSNYYQILSQVTTNTTVEHLTINGAKDGRISQLSYAFNGIQDTTLKRFTVNCDFSNVGNFDNAFNIRGLEIIDGIPIDMSSSTNCNAFAATMSLREVRFAPLSIKARISFGQAPNLSNGTIQSIIDGLADLTGETAQTLTLHKEVGAKLTDEQKAVITVKNWILAY